MMTREERECIKQFIDARQRERIAKAMQGIKRCVGCGTELDFWTLGCKVCHNRHTAAFRKGYKRRMSLAQFIRTREIYVAESIRADSERKVERMKGKIPANRKPGAASIAWKNRSFVA